MLLSGCKGTKNNAKKRHKNKKKSPQDKSRHQNGNGSYLFNLKNAYFENCNASPMQALGC